MNKEVHANHCQLSLTDSPGHRNTFAESLSERLQEAALSRSTRALPMTAVAGCGRTPGNSWAGRFLLNRPSNSAFAFGQVERPLFRALNIPDRPAVAIRWREPSDSFRAHGCRWIGAGAGQFSPSSSPPWLASSGRQGCHSRVARTCTRAPLFSELPGPFHQSTFQCSSDESTPSEQSISATPCLRPSHVSSLVIACARFCHWRSGHAFVRRPFVANIPLVVPELHRAGRDPRAGSRCSGQSSGPPSSWNRLGGKRRVVRDF